MKGMEDHKSSLTLLGCFFQCDLPSPGSGLKVLGSSVLDFCLTAPHLPNQSSTGWAGKGAKNCARFHPYPPLFEIGCDGNERQSRISVRVYEYSNEGTKTVNVCMV